MDPKWRIALCYICSPEPHTYTALLWQKEASDKSDISCKRAKCVCHLHWRQWNIMMSYLKPQSHYSDNQSPTSRSRQPSATISNQFPTKMLVLNRSPTVCRPIADCLPTGRRVVDNQLPITRRLIIEHTSHFRTWSATIWRVIADWSPTVWRDVICIIFWITLPSKEIPTFLRPYVDSFMNTCWNFFWNEGDTIDYVNQLQQPVADQLRTTLPLFLHHLHFSGSKCIFILYGSLVWLSMVVDAASKTSGRPKLLGDHQQPFADHRKPPGKRVVVGGRREVVDVILWQPVTDHRQTFADLRQPPATTPKIVVVRGRRLVVAIVWPSLNISLSRMSVYAYNLAWEKSTLGEIWKRQ